MPPHTHYVLRTLATLGVLLVSSGLGWRYASRRWSLPCPAWLAWVLENPLMETLASSRRIVEGLDLRPGMVVLDVGCGPGRVAIPAARRVGPDGTVIALDLQPAMLHKLLLRAAAADVHNIRPVLGAIGQGHLGEIMVDRAWMVTVLGEIPDRGQALREVYARLRPGGVLAIAEVVLDPHYQPVRTIRQLATANGFQIRRQTGTWATFTLYLVKPHMP